MSEFGLGLNVDADEVAQRKGNITSMVQMGSVAGALIAFVACDKIGKLSDIQRVQDLHFGSQTSWSSL
jgi:hypothetical protein